MLLIVRTIGLALFFFAHSSFDYHRKKQHQEQERKSKKELAMKETIRAIENENQRLEELNKALIEYGYNDYSGTHTLRHSMGSYTRKEAGLDTAQAMLSHSSRKLCQTRCE